MRWLALAFVFFAFDAFAQACPDPLAVDVQAAYDATSQQWAANLETCARTGADHRVRSIELVWQGIPIGCMPADSGQTYQLLWPASVNGALSANAWNGDTCTGSFQVAATNQALVDISQIPPVMVCPDPATPDVVATFSAGLWTVGVKTCPAEPGSDPIQSVEFLYEGVRVGCVPMSDGETQTFSWLADEDGEIRATSWSELGCVGSAHADSPNAGLVTLTPILEPKFVP